jgi:hypothetical protein
LLTAERIGRDGRYRRRPPAATAWAPLWHGAYWNVTGKDRVLFAVFFSPGTGATVAVTV